MPAVVSTFIFSSLQQGIIIKSTTHMLSKQTEPKSSTKRETGTVLSTAAHEVTDYRAKHKRDGK